MKRVSKELRVKDELLFNELEESRISLLKLVQTEYFVDQNDSRIKNLDVIKDNNSLLRLKSRIVLRDDIFSFKCPIVLPCTHHIVDLILIIREKHENLMHAGVEITMNALREEYWILGGRKIIRAVIRKCVIVRDMTRSLSKQPERRCL